ncbi:MAG: putative DEAD/DEAH box helicase domain protein [Parcubacteria group bacterium Gr01-1014_56]|nr:MAG: putative DEAD/DEAH box helicase domain protein [Parcubacteria group bacterium Gr01-1014_56]
MYQKRFNNKGPRFSHGRPAYKPHFQQKKNRGGGGEYIDPSKFINKAIITEEVEHFVPEHQFTDFVIDQELKHAVVAKGYTTPTPIQDRAIPHVLKGQDVVGIANTGTGKTAAFLIPLIDKVRHDTKAQVLIVVPTRELAIQIDAELKGFTKGMKIFSVVCVGGASIGPQLQALKYRNQFVIGTPGRLKDLIERGKIRLSDYGTIVLDEADRMLDMGFINDMRFVMQGMPKPRHTLFFSATLSREIEGLISEFLHEPVRISVKTGDTAKNVDQDVVRVKGGAKLDILHDLLAQKEFNKVLVFGRTKHGVERLAKTLADRGFKAESIHGNKNHSQRQRALNAFKDNKVQILVATDVAARGLDIADVSHVINFDLPQSYDDYVHRIGRTGRGKKKGKALTFVE